MESEKYCESYRIQMTLSEREAKMLDFHNFLLEDRSIRLPYTLSEVLGDTVQLRTTNPSSIFSSINCSAVANLDDRKLYIAILPIMKTFDVTGNRYGSPERGTTNKEAVIILAKLAGITTKEDYSLFLDPLLPYRV
jgi:hypothetical protein